VKLLYQLGEGAAVTAAVAGLSGEKAAGLVEVLAGVGSRETAEAAVGFLAKADAAAAVQEAAVKGLGRHGEGQKLLLESAKGGTLPAAVRDAVAAVLATATDEAIRAEAATVIPMAAEVKLAPVSELAKRTGDVTKGQVVYMTYCFTCHQVNGVGVDFGPALSEIGSKLAKEAMYDAILNPSAGISFGFEGWEVTMKDGTVWTGMIASETDAEVSLKVPGGILQKCAKGEITGRKKLAVSLMTPKLGTVIPEADLVDLVEYLGSLKKKP
jgi:putative heme-binding domain-containing protein